MAGGRPGRRVREAEDRARRAHRDPARDDRGRAQRRRPRDDRGGSNAGPWSFSRGPICPAPRRSCSCPRASRPARTSSWPSGWWPRCVLPGDRPGSSSPGPVDPHRRTGRCRTCEQLLALRRALRLEDCAWFLSAELERPPSDAMMDDLYQLGRRPVPAQSRRGLRAAHPRGGRSPAPDRLHRPAPRLRELAGDAALYIGPDDAPEHVAARILQRLDGDPAARLATEVRTRYTWDAIYRERIAPLLDVVASAA